MDRYPTVRDEYETIEHLLATGCSIARFGDGEIKLMDGGSQVREPRNPKLAAELTRVISDPDPRCIVGIPTMDPKGPKIRNWEERKLRTLKCLTPEVRYFSAFISRPDSAPWILTRKYAEMVCDLWRSRRVAVVCQPTNSILTVLRKTTTKIKQFECPSHEAYSRIDEFESEILRGRFDTAVLSCGPAASCLAHRLSKKGVRAIDIGSGGGFLSKLLDMDPLGDLRAVVLKRPEHMTVEQMKEKLEREWEMRFFDEKER